MHGQPAVVRHLFTELQGQFPVIFIGIASAAFPLRGKLPLDKSTYFPTKGFVFRTELEFHGEPLR